MSEGLGESLARMALDLGAALMGAGLVEGLLVCDRSGGVSFCNAAAAAILGIPPAAAAGRVLAELFASNETTALRFASAVHEAEAAEFVVARPGADDEWLEVRTAPTERGVAFFLKDVTERERSERMLRRKEQRLLATNESLRLAHAAARAASWEWRAGRGLRWIDLAAARELAGLPAKWTEEDVLTDWRAMLSDDEVAALERTTAELRWTDAHSAEFRIRGADGAVHWMQSSAAVVARDAAGAPHRVCGITVDITEHKASEQKLQEEVSERRRAEAHQRLLIHELNHRVKNMLATVQAVARQSLRRKAAGPGAYHDFERRLMALAWAHDALTREQWAGASLLVLARRTLEAHAEEARTLIAGPDLRVSPKMALALAMGLHELATNATKYGALSTEAGRVALDWRVDAAQEPPWLELEWREEGGPPVTPPGERGFGSRLIERGLAAELGGEAQIRFEAEGVRCLIRAPLHELETGDLPQMTTTPAARDPA